MLGPLYRIRILPEASKDLIQITDFIKQDSPDAAIAAAETLFAAIDSLDHAPHRFRIHKSSKRPHRVVRSMSTPPYIVYYRVMPQDCWVEVLTIRHGAQRQPKRF